jgi:tetratricopeptide (TPR) repeat protein
MRWLLALAGSVILAISSTVQADEKRDCFEVLDYDLRIKACSVVIDSNPNDAIAHYSRGVAYQFQGEVDRAISDFNKAIELNPYHASAYDNRARAYAGKGDYIHAVADVTKASELAYASTTEGKKITGEGVPSKREPEEVKTAAAAIAKIAKNEEIVPKKSARAAKEVKIAPHVSHQVAKKATPQIVGDAWPTWAPQGNSDN